MLIPSIIAMLTMSIASDERDDSEQFIHVTRGGIGYLSFVIFRWSDGATISRCVHRPMSLRGSLPSRYGEEVPLFVYKNHDQQSHFYFWLNSENVPVYERFRDSYLSEDLDYYRMEWLVLEYMEGVHSTGTHIPALPSFEEYQPDYAAPYEVIVYESNQMSKSLFLLGQDDFKKTIGVE